mmetsp:Transcript_65848/g.144434  ORF Transcript_65848/g.144434 Transcript_65848/m.144434 type:complete len:232 (+) Transcript_65848:592-1287(+)
MSRFSEGTLVILDRDGRHARIANPLQRFSSGTAHLLQQWRSDVAGRGQDQSFASQALWSLRRVIVQDVHFCLLVVGQLRQLPLQPNGAAMLRHVLTQRIAKLLEAFSKGSDRLAFHLWQARVPRLCRFRCSVLEKFDGTSHQGAGIFLQHLDAASGSFRGQRRRVARIDAADEGVDQTFEGLFSQVSGHELLHGFFFLGHRLLDAHSTQACPDLAGPGQEVTQDRIRRGGG